MTALAMLLKIKIHPASYGFSQYRSYTDFDINLDGFIQILAWTFDYYDVKLCNFYLT